MTRVKKNSTLYELTDILLLIAIRYEKAWKFTDLMVFVCISEWEAMSWKSAAVLFDILEIWKISFHKGDFCLKELFLSCDMFR